MKIAASAELVTTKPRIKQNAHALDTNIVACAELETTK